MSKKLSKSEEIMARQGTTTGRTLFGNQSPYQAGLQTGGNTSAPEAGEGYQYRVVDIASIDDADTAFEIPNALRKSVEERVIQPVVLLPVCEQKTRGGKTYNSPTGRYEIIDGHKRIKILLDAGRVNISALVLPSNISEDELNKIKKTVSENKQTGVENVIRDVTETLDEQITYCYRYENINVNVEDLVERDNQYSMDQEGINELEKSIFKLGLLQPIVVIPVMDPNTMKVKYKIQSGHRRTRAIKQLIKHAEEGSYPGNKELILASFKTIPALLIPMGSSDKDVEDIYNQTNMLSRHMTVEDCFKVIESFSCLPSRPTTKEEFVHFKETTKSINILVKMVQDEMRKIGFQDWKNTKTSKFLNVYFYGSDKAIKLFTHPEDSAVNQKDIYWIVIQNKDFVERKKQDELLKLAQDDKEEFESYKNDNGTSRKIYEFTTKKVMSTLRKQKSEYDKIKDNVITDRPSEEQKVEIKRLINETRMSLMGLEQKLSEIE